MMLIEYNEHSEKTSESIEEVDIKLMTCSNCISSYRTNVYLFTIVYQNTFTDMNDSGRGWRGTVSKLYYNCVRLFPILSFH